MKTRLWLCRCRGLLALALACPLTLLADMGNWQHAVGLGGRTAYAPAELPATAFNYSLSKPLQNHPWFYHQVNFGLWHRQENRIPAGVIVIPTGEPLPYYTTAYGAYGIGLRSRGRWYAYIDHGIALISETTPYLGTHWQFLTSAGIGFRQKNRTYDCGVKHLSNGSRYFGSPGINAGEDFFFCSVSIRK